MAEIKVRERGTEAEGSFLVSSAVGLAEPGFPSVGSVEPSCVRSRLSVMPLSVLLPPGEDLALLLRCRGIVEMWLEREEQAERPSFESIVMLKQVLFWLAEAGDGEGMSEEPARIIGAIYELGRLYYESGFLSAAERIFQGLHAFEPSFTPAVLASGIVRIERTHYNESMSFFRDAIQQGRYVLEAKLGLCASFIALGETRRAGSMLQELTKPIKASEIDPEVRRLWHAFSHRCGIEVANSVD